MDTIITMLLLVFAMIAIVKAINNSEYSQKNKRPKQAKAPEAPPVQHVPVFQKRDYFFRSVKEREFFNTLTKALSETPYTVFAQVRLADLIKSNPNDYHAKNMYLKTLPYQVDFLICSGNTYQIILAIELDSPFHHTIEQQERDLFKSKVLAEAKIPLLRFRVEEELTPIILKARLAEPLKIAT